MIIQRLFATSNEEAVEKLLKEAEKHGIHSHNVDQMPEGAAAFYFPKKFKKISDFAKAAVDTAEKSAEKSGHTMSPKDIQNAEFLKNIHPGDIHLVRGEKDPFIIGHEIGHGINERSKLRNIPKSGLLTLGIKSGALYGGYKAGKAEDSKEKNQGRAIGGASILAGNLRTPVDEHLASQYSLKKLKEYGVDKEFIKESKKYANKNTFAYLNPKDIIKNPGVRAKVVAPLAINGGLYLTGKAIGHAKKNKNKGNSDDKK